MSKKNKSSKEIRLDKEFFMIGEVSKICGITQKTLRYYDAIGLIKPDHIQEDNHYRLYSRETLLRLPLIKYYKDIGYNLEEIQALMKNEDRLSTLKKSFKEKMFDIQRKQRILNTKYDGLMDWYNLLIEGEDIIKNNTKQVRYSYMPAIKCSCCVDEFDSSYPIKTLINNTFVNSIRDVKKLLRGPLFLNFSDYTQRMSSYSGAVSLYMEVHEDSEEIEPYTLIGDFNYISTFHVGSYDYISHAYKRIIDWADTHNFQLSKNCYERYVIDYWSSLAVNQFVTEIIIPVV